MTTWPEVGSVVRLKSGGPNMTVGDFQDPAARKDKDDKRVLVHWFDGDDLRTAWFRVESLEEV